MQQGNFTTEAFTHIKLTLSNAFQAGNDRIQLANIQPPMFSELIDTQVIGTLT